MEKTQIQIFVTGGTFDKEYNYITGKLYFKNTHLFDMFELGRSTLDVDIKTLMMMDSLEMTDLDRKRISEQCLKTKASKILITHGTDTMVDTAKFLVDQEVKKKTIVITGAMVPYAFGTSSDGFFNLGAALAYVQCMPAGVFICMNGKIFDWCKVKKNKNTGFFEEIN